MMLFNPRDRALSTEFIRYHCALYDRLLKCYLMDKYRNVKVANSKYEMLMEQIALINKMTANIRRLCSTVDSRLLPPLMKEILDIGSTI